MTHFEQLIFSEFDGSNYQELATKYKLTTRAVHQIIARAQQAAETEAKFTRGAVLLGLFTQLQDLGLLTFRPLLPAESTRPGLAVFASHSQTPPTAPPVDQPALQTHQGQAQDRLDSSPLSVSGASSVQSQRPVTQQCGCSGTRNQHSTSMSPFTQFLGRLVELVGAENATKLTREFAGQALQFPITDHYGDTIERRVTNRLSIHYRGVAYDVSHLPNAAVGELITVNVADLKPIKPDDFGFATDAPIIGERYKPLTKAEAKAIADKLLQAPIAYQPTAEEIAYRDAVIQVAEACNVSLSAAIHILKAERQRPTAPLSSAGTAPAQDQSGLEGHAGIGVQSEADPNQ